MSFSNFQQTGRIARLRRPAAIAAALLTAVALSACGNANQRETTGTYAGDGGVAAPYLSVGPLVYQVQMSRALNPYDTEDKAYLEGVPVSERKLNPGEEWFGVFVKVFNETGKPHPDATEMTVSDTEGNVYHPIAVKSTNLYSYRPTVIAGKGEIPLPSSTAYSGPIGGALLLYKIKLESLDNRPLKIHIVSPTNPTETASAELDV
jgi:hypothetical protein